MLIGVLKETFPGEKRVALVPAEVQRLTKKKLDVAIEAGAGLEAGYTDEQYAAKGAKIGLSRDQLMGTANMLLMVRGHEKHYVGLQPGQVVIGFLDPLGSPRAMSKLGAAGVYALAMELMPRITRAQSMDALSSMANIAGYKAVLLAAHHSPKLFPMMITAAGTVSSVKALVLGAGVAGLQAIATAKRLGAVVEAYDVRPEVREQVQSVGGKFIELKLDTAAAGDAGGYAKAQSADFYRQQQEQLAHHVRAADVIITTAAIPGRRAPVLITRAMLEGAKQGSVLVDLAAETGGNCELTRVGEAVVHNGMTILGPANLASSAAFHASQLYARNVSTFVANLCSDDGQLQLRADDEIVRDTLVAQGGEVVNTRVLEAIKTAA